MTINALSQMQQTQPTRREVSENGITRVYEDRNGDGKLDLYSITKKAQNLFEPNTRIETYYDKDGDGLCDERKDIVIPNENIPEGVALVVPNVVKNEGQDLKALTEKTIYKNLAEKPKMADILNPKQQKNDTSWLF